ncbi:ABC transporter substrate-binding protein [Bradyrhizobium canariense]|uniref:NitT/TauT family transport system substrate-binding protein n=1 Tax=Bradyrhizobium canariense TaxID=255045 RepID=A0A1H1U4K3_9BRAD|nr:ABC transporter substrate-binding protein [Bradyrhizobium canariense]SDS67324.1 NitT/TauT family transport system substrate-binding protein [Bradyrhizobium canariense]
MKCLRIAGLALALAAPAAPLHAAESVNLILNWTPTADHSPFYYAKAQGWYEKAGIDLTIEVGKGSGVSALKVGSGGSPFGIADLATMLVARSKGADDVALMSIYANTGQTFYWLKSYGVNGVKDFPGHKIGNPPGDASRVMWPAFAKAAGIAPDSVNFVNVGPTAKIAALKSHTVDIISDFYNEHDLKVSEFGSDLGFINWKDIGLNPYGNSLIVNGAFLQKNPKLVEDFVRITQKAYAACVADAAPCLKALLDQVSGLDEQVQKNQWERIKFLMTDDFTTTKALGWIDGERMKKDYELVQTYLGMEKPFPVDSAFTTGMLDTSIKMDASKVRK